MACRLFSSKVVFFYLLLSGLTGLLTACGGSGGGSAGLPAELNTYSGSEVDATVSDQTVAGDILLSLAQSSQSNSLGQYTTSISTDANSSSLGQDKIKNVLAEKFIKDAEDIASQLLQQQTVIAAGQVSVGNCATELGSPANGSASQNVVQQSDTQVIVDITYNNLCITDPLNPVFTAEMDGVVRITIKGSNFTGADAGAPVQVTETDMYMPNISVIYTDLATLAVYQDSFTMNIVITYSYDTDGFLIGSTITVFTDIDYQTIVYRFGDYDDGAGTVLSEFYHPTHGVVEYTHNVEFDDCSGVLTEPVPIGTASVTNTTSNTGATFNSTCTLVAGSLPGYEICLTDGNGVNPTDCTIYSWP